MGRIIHIDVNGAVEKLTLGLKGVLEKVVTEIVGVSNSKKEADINGLREQIIANVAVLTPIMKGAKPRGGDDTANAVRKVGIKVVTIGEEPKIRSYVLVGNGAHFEKLFESGAAATVNLALTNLLNLTQQLLEKHIDGCVVRGSHSNSSSNSSGKSYSNSDSASSRAPPSDSSRGSPRGLDWSGWDSNVLFNPLFHTAGSFEYAISNDDDSIDSAVGGCGRGLGGGATYGAVRANIAATLTAPTAVSQSAVNVTPAEEAPYDASADDGEKSWLDI